MDRFFFSLKTGKVFFGTIPNWKNYVAQFLRNQAVSTRALAFLRERTV